MRKLPPLSALRCFEVAGDHDSFTVAAERLCLSPSAVSHHIRLLEEYLDAQLFVRQGKKVSLTQVGREYHAKVRQAFDLISECTGDVRGGNARHQAIYIRAAPSFGNAWLTPHLAEFLNEFSNVEIHVATEDFPSALGSSRVDCEIRYGRTAQPGIVALPICTERLIPLCSASVARSVGDAQQLLQTVTLIHTQSRPVGWRDFFREHRALGTIRRASSERAVFFDRSTYALEAAREGLGLALESDVLAQGDLANGRLVAPFGTSGIPGETYYFVAREAAEGSIVYAFYRWLTTSINQSRGDLAAAHAA
jgi:LysR family glycine cleavage system transcriptional activator